MITQSLAEVPTFYRRGTPIERTLYRIGSLLVASGLVHLVVFWIDGGPWEGPVSWRKPVTFGVSFGLTVVTIAWVTSFLAMSERWRTRLLGAFAASSVLEVGLITLQAWRRRPSHFDVETTVDSIISRVLAVGGVAIIAILVAFTVVAFRPQEALPASLRLALRAGFATLLASMAFGALMIARGVIEEATGSQQRAYVVGGTLKPAHAVTMHAVLVLPALAWLLTFSRWPEAVRVRIVQVAIGGYAVAAAVVIAWSFVGYVRG